MKDTGDGHDAYMDIDTTVTDTLFCCSTPSSLADSVSDRGISRPTNEHLAVSLGAHIESSVVTDQLLPAAMW